MELIRNIIVSLILRGLSTLFSFLMTFLVARQLSINDAGLFFLGLAIATIFSQITTFGYQLASLKYVSIEVSRGGWAKVKGYIYYTFYSVLLISSTVAVIMFLSRNYIAELIFSKPEMADVLSFFSISIIFSSLTYLISHYFQAFEKKIISNFSLSIGQPFFMIVFLVVCNRFSESSVSSMYMFSCALTFIVTFICLARVEGLNTKMSVIDTDEFRSTAIPLGITSMMVILLSWSSQFIAGIWVEPEDIAKLAVSQRVANLISLMLIAVNMIVGPKFAAYHREGNKENLLKTYVWSLRFIIVISLPIGAVIFCFPSFILSFFGSKFQDASTLLIIFSLGQFFNVFSGAVGLMLTMTGHEVDMRNIVIISGCLTIVLSFVTIPIVGVIGAALSTSVCLVIQNILCVYYVKKRLQVGLFKELIIMK